MIIKIKKEEEELLLWVLCKRTPDLEMIAKNSRALILRHGIRKEICQVLADELCESGLNPDSEPNDYGFKLEHLNELMHPGEEDD